MPSMPLVAVSMSRGFPKNNGVPMHYLSEAYTNALIASGIIPLLIPSTIAVEGLRAIYERVDGIVLSGGGDMHPSCLGMDANDAEATFANDIDEQRDAIEINLTRWAYDDDKPLLGICRGHQVLNVALGGSLVMDIPAAIGTTVPHRVDSTPQWRRAFLHSVTVSEGTRLASILGEGEIRVNSIHHQAVKGLGEGLQAVAIAPDGVIEAVEIPQARFFVGVQWHPEEIYDAMKPLFESFAAVMR
jgi:putative glutamine amidotransferase